mgnify:CR=1 FL=1
MSSKESEERIWDAYNTLLCCGDVERMRKLLARYWLFMKTLHLPGDIVECGVFKGTSLLMFLKFLHIHCHGSEKKVIGFDFFGNTKQEVLEELTGNDHREMGELFEESNFEGIDEEELQRMAQNIYPNHCTLVNGDISRTVSEFVNANPGMRISLLHMDLDVEKPTFDALKALWPRVVRGGIVVLDEYAISKWSESEAVDAFLKDKDVMIHTEPWMRTPSAYIIKN